MQCEAARVHRAFFCPVAMLPRMRIRDHGSSVLSEEFYSWLVETSIKTLRKYM